MSEKNTSNKVSQLPPSLIGFWIRGNTEYEITASGEYRTVTRDAPYILSGDGLTLQMDNIDHSRLGGSTDSLLGKWRSQDGEEDVWEFFDAGNFTLQSVGYSTHGEFSFNTTTLTRREFRATITESNGLISLSPPNGTPEIGPWSINGTTLLIHLPSGQLIFERA